MWGFGQFRQSTGATPRGWSGCARATLAPRATRRDVRACCCFRAASGRMTPPRRTLMPGSGSRTTARRRKPFVAPKPARETPTGASTTGATSPQARLLHRCGSRPQHHHRREQGCGMTSKRTFILSREAERLGSDRELRRKCAAGLLSRVAPGVYMEKTEWASLDPDERYRARVQAASLRSRPGAQFSHDSAAAMFRLPSLGPWPVARQRARAGAAVRRWNVATRHPSARPRRRSCTDGDRRRDRHLAATHPRRHRVRCSARAGGGDAR